MYIAVGLGNPGEEYLHTRHNTGRLALEFVENTDVKGVKFIHLDTFMNKSGMGVAKVVKSKKAAQKLIVIYDDLDLPLGAIKVSYNRGSGGHRGVESITRALKTEEFIRIRVGISPTTPSGKLKKPKGDTDVEKHILGEFKKSEMEILKKVFKKVAEAVRLLSTETLQGAMTKINSN
jgi:peptidyl-tRNA hydrolase, PTH1 family